MADVAILAAQTQAAPGGYTIPASVELLLKTVRASYDGSGADGSYVPTLRLVPPGPSGVPPVDYTLGQTLAAGASADVTWFPGMKAAAAAVTTPGLGDYLAADTTAHQVITNDGVFNAIVFDDGVFAGGAGSVTLNADNKTVQLAHAGSYDVSVSVQWDNTDTTGSRLVSADIVSVVSHNIDLFGQTSETTQGASSFANPTPLQTYHWTPVFNANGKFRMNVACQGAAGTVKLNYAQITVNYIAPLGS